MKKIIMRLEEGLKSYLSKSPGLDFNYESLVHFLRPIKEVQAEIDLPCLYGEGLLGTYATRRLELETKLKDLKENLKKELPRYAKIKEDIVPALRFWDFLVLDFEDCLHDQELDFSLQEIKRKFLRGYVSNSNKFISIIAMLESLPVRVSRMILFDCNIESTTPETFFRRLEPEHFKIIEDNYDALFTGEPVLPPVFKVKFRFKNFRDKARGRLTPELLLAEPENLELRELSKGAWSYDLFGIDFGFNKYPNGILDDTKVVNKSIFKFISIKGQEEEFVVNTEFGRYFFAFKKVRSNLLWGRKKVVELGKYICPGAITTLIIGALFLTSPFVFTFTTMPIVTYALLGESLSYLFVFSGIPGFFWMVLKLISFAWGLLLPAYFVVGTLKVILEKIFKPIFDIPVVRIISGCIFIAIMIAMGGFILYHRGPLAWSFTVALIYDAYEVLSKIPSLYLIVGGVLLSSLVYYAAAVIYIKKGLVSPFDIPLSWIVTRIAPASVLIAVGNFSYAHREVISSWVSNYWIHLLPLGFSVILIFAILTLFSLYSKIEEKLEKLTKNQKKLYRSVADVFRKVLLTSLVLGTVAVISLSSFVAVNVPSRFDSSLLIMILGLLGAFCFIKGLDIYTNSSYEKMLDKSLLLEKYGRYYHLVSSMKIIGVLSKNKWISSLQEKELEENIGKIEAFLGKLHCRCEPCSEFRCRCDKPLAPKKELFLLYFLREVNEKSFEILMEMDFYPLMYGLGLSGYHPFDIRSDFVKLVFKYQDLELAKEHVLEKNRWQESSAAFVAEAEKRFSFALKVFVKYTKFIWFVPALIIESIYTFYVFFKDIRKVCPANHESKLMFKL